MTKTKGRLPLARVTLPYIPATISRTITNRNANHYASGHKDKS
uniref:Uncharacterized protein n=1 Tax=Arundo donax TaxID=35708 RepID=A0A0A9ELM9_ARUDO